MDPRSIEMLTVRLSEVDLRCSVLEVAEELPRIYRDLAEALGDAEAGRRFDTALSRALAVTGA